MKNPKLNKYFNISEMHANVDGVFRVHFFSVDPRSNKVVGMISLELNLPETAKAIDLFVEPDYRHRGHGGALMRAAHAWAIKNHGPYFFFTAQSSNERLVAWYLRLGYCPIGRDLHDTYFVPKEE